MKSLRKYINVPDPPSRMDPLASNAILRLHTCETISYSGIFDSFDNVQPISMQEAYAELQQPHYSNIFNQIYGLHPPHKYTNFYTPHNININLRIGESSTLVSTHRHDFVFMCLMLRKIDFLGEDPNKEDIGKSDSHEKESIIPFYVSKMYNVHRGLHARRFIFLNHGIVDNTDLMLMEQSAKPYIRPDFNIELHYLQLRKYSRPGKQKMPKRAFYDHSSSQYFCLNC